MIQGGDPLVPARGRFLATASGRICGTLSEVRRPGALAMPILRPNTKTVSSSSSRGFRRTSLPTVPPAIQFWAVPRCASVALVEERIGAACRCGPQDKAADAGAHCAFDDLLRGRCGFNDTAPGAHSATGNDQEAQLLATTPKKPATTPQ